MGPRRTPHRCRSTTPHRSRPTRAFAAPPARVSTTLTDRSPPSDPHPRRRHPRRCHPRFPRYAPPDRHPSEPGARRRPLEPPARHRRRHAAPPRRRARRRAASPWPPTPRIARTRRPSQNNRCAPGTDVDRAGPLANPDRAPARRPARSARTAYPPKRCPRGRSAPPAAKRSSCCHPRRVSDRSPGRGPIRAGRCSRGREAPRGRPPPPCGGDSRDLRTISGHRIGDDDRGTCHHHHTSRSEHPRVEVDPTRCRSPRHRRRNRYTARCART